MTENSRKIHIKCSKCKVGEPVQYLSMEYEGFGNQVACLVCFCKDCFNFDLTSYAHEIYDNVENFK